MNNANLLLSIPKFVSLTAEEIALFISLLRPKYLAKGVFLLREEEISKYETFVQRGIKNWLF